MEENNFVSWNLQVPKPLDAALEDAVKKDTHSSKSEFIRDVVRRELEKKGILK